VNLPDAIERLRRMHADSVEAAEKWRAINAVRGLGRFRNGLEESNAKDACAIAACLEALSKPPIDTTKSAPPLTASEQVAGIWGKGKGLFDGPRDENGIPEP
jgi:hypothetical protein